MTSKKLILATVSCIAALSACARDYPSPTIPKSVEVMKDAAEASAKTHANLGDVKTDTLSDKDFHSFLREHRKALYFDSGKSDLSRDHKEVLDALVDRSERYNDYNILIVAHADSVGDEDKNMTLSEERFLAVTDYLRKRSVAPSNIVTRVRGEHDPAVVGDSDYRHARNRRVEVYLVLDRSEYSPGFKVTPP